MERRHENIWGVRLWRDLVWSCDSVTSQDQAIRFPPSIIRSFDWTISIFHRSLNWAQDMSSKSSRNCPEIWVWWGRKPFESHHSPLDAQLAVHKYQLDLWHPWGLKRWTDFYWDAILSNDNWPVSMVCGWNGLANIYSQPQYNLYRFGNDTTRTHQFYGGVQQDAQTLNWSLISGLYVEAKA